MLQRLPTTYLVWCLAALAPDLLRDASLVLIVPLHVLHEKPSFLSKTVLRVDYMPAKHFCKHLFLSLLLSTHRCIQASTKPPKWP